MLLVHGDADFIVPFTVAEKLKAIYGDNAELVPVHGADHFYAAMPYQHQRLDVTTAFFEKVFF